MEENLNYSLLQEGKTLKVSASLVKLKGKIFLIVAMQKYYGFTKFYTSLTINTLMSGMAVLKKNQSIGKCMNQQSFLST